MVGRSSEELIWEPGAQVLAWALDALTPTPQFVLLTCIPA